MDCTTLLNAVCMDFITLLGDNMVGFYVHGSIAFKCFRWERSDVDFIVVVNEPLHQQTKLRLLSSLETFRPYSPPKGLEMSIVLRKYCRPFVYPTPFELHFSPYHLKRYLKDPLSLCGDEIKTDPDLAAHFTVINHIGITWHGLPIQDIFAHVPEKHYIDSLYRDVQSAQTNLSDDPVNIILNLCRVYAYLKDGLVCSKADGGRWALSKLRERWHAPIHSALNIYLNDLNPTSDDALNSAFCMEMLKRIRSLLL